MPLVRSYLCSAGSHPWHQAPDLKPRELLQRITDDTLRCEQCGELMYADREQKMSFTTSFVIVETP